MDINEARKMGFIGKSEIYNRSVRKHRNLQAAKKILNIEKKKAFIIFCNEYEKRTYNRSQKKELLEKPLIRKKRILKEIPTLKKAVKEYDGKVFNRKFEEVINEKLKRIKISVEKPYKTALLKNTIYVNIYVKFYSYESERLIYDFSDCLFYTTENGKPRIDAEEVIKRISQFEEDLNWKIKKMENSRDREEIEEMYKKISRLQKEAMKKYDQQITEKLYLIPSKILFGY